MKMLKHKLKIILVIIASAIFVSGLSVYATYNYFAKDISYTKTDGTEISVEDALNDLYDNRSLNLELVNVINGGKNSSSSNYSAVLTSNTLDEGNYLVIICEARRNNNSLGTLYNTTDTIGTLSGCTTSSVLLCTKNGTYYESSSSRANLRTNMFECYLENSGTITFTLDDNGGDDVNATMIIYKK